MAGTKIDEALVTDGGILGDRGYAVIDRESGRVGSAKTPRKWAGLMALAADFVSPTQPGAPLPPVRIVWPDGTAVSSEGGDPDARLSDTLGRAGHAHTTERPEAPSLERLDPLATDETIVDIRRVDDGRPVLGLRGAASDNQRRRWRASPSFAPNRSSARAASAPM